MPSTIFEISEFTEKVYLIKTNDYIVGGEKGPANAQARAIANRTRWLYDRILTELEPAKQDIENRLGVATEFRLPWKFNIRGTVFGEIEVQKEITDIRIRVDIKDLVVNDYLIISHNHSNSENIGQTNPVYYGVRNGLGLFQDEEFKDGVNSITTYSGNGFVELECDVRIDRILSNVAMNSSGRQLRVTHTSKPTFSPATQTVDGFGGFKQQYNTQVGKKYVHVFKARLPVGFQFNIAYQFTGSQTTRYWLTGNVGTGKIEEYAYVFYPGEFFSQMGMVFVTSIDPDYVLEQGDMIIWDLSSSNVFEITNQKNSNIISQRLGFTPVNKLGDTMTSHLKLFADPEMQEHGCPKHKVDTFVSQTSENIRNCISTISDLNKDIDRLDRDLSNEIARNESTDDEFQTFLAKIRSCYS